MELGEMAMWLIEKGVKQSLRFQQERDEIEHDVGYVGGKCKEDFTRYPHHNYELNHGINTYA